MRTVEECYEYVIARRNERAAQRRKKRELVLKTAVPVCGIAVMTGVGLVVRNGITGSMTKPSDSSSFSESSTVNNESTAPSDPTSSNVTSNVDNSGENSAGGDTSHTSEPLDDKPAYDGVFKGVNGSYVIGPPMSYEEIMEMLVPVEGYSMWDVDSFYLVETVRALSSDECRQLAGMEDFDSTKTVYEIKVLEDLISGEKTNRTERILVTMGNIEWQNAGDPIYAPGEKFTVILAKPYEGSDFLRTPGAFAFRYDVASDDDGSTILYSRESELDVLQLDTAEDIDESVITSTTHNPAHYTQKLSLNALVEFLRSDWEQRGMSSHFDNA